MPSRWLEQIDFSSGELDPRAERRLDIERYRSALARARNVVLDKTGAARRRDGWRYVQDVPGNVAVQLEGWQRGDEDFLLAIGEDTNLHLFDSSGSLVESFAGTQDGYVLSVLFANLTPTVSADGQQQQHLNQAAEQGQTNAFGRVSPPLAGKVTPSWARSAGSSDGAVMISVAVTAAAAPDPPFAIDADSFHDQNAAASSWDKAHTFSSDANLVLVLISGERSNATPVQSVVIDPDGAAIPLTKLEERSQNNVHFCSLWGAFAFTAQSGEKTIRATMTGGQAPGSMEIITFIGAGRLPEDRDVDFVVTGGWNTVETEITVPEGGFGESSVGRIDTASDSQAMLFFHEDVAPQWLRRTEVGGWEFDEYPIEAYPYHRFQEPGVTVDPSNTTGTITLTTSAPHWLPEHVGSVVRFGAGHDRIRVTAYQSATVVDAEVLDTLPNHTATTDWDEQVWSDGRGWPVSGCWHQGRLVIGGARDLRDGLWASKSGEIEGDATGISFDQGELADDEAIWARMRADEGVAIEYVRSQGPLVILASGTEWIVAQQPVTPANVAFERQASQGVARLKPADLDGAILYLRSKRASPGQDGEQPIIYFAWDELSQRYRPDDIAVLGQHLVRNPVAMAAARGSTSDANNTLFLANDDGTVAALHLPSVDRPGVTLFEGAVQPYSVAVSAGQLFCAARFADAHRIFQLDPDVTMDASVTFNNGASFETALGPYAWLADQDVTVKGWTENDGWVVEDVTGDEDGLVTVATAMRHGEVGIAPAWQLRRLPLDAAPATIGSLKSAVEARVVVENALGVEIGDDDGRTPATLDDGSDPGDLATDPATLHSGHLREHLGGWSEDPVAEVGGTKPWPARVLAFNVKVEF